MESDAKPEFDTPPKSNRRWLQFSTRALLVIVTVAGVTLGILGWRAERQRSAVAAIKALGGKVLYESDNAMLEEFAEFLLRGGTPPAERPKGWLPRDWIECVVVVNLDDSEVTDADLIHLQSLPRLTTIYLNNTQIGDAGVAHLDELSRIEGLNAHHTQITDVGAARLQRHGNLKWIGLVGTQVTDDGIRELQSALPNSRTFH